MRGCLPQVSVPFTPWLSAYQPALAAHPCLASARVQQRPRNGPPPKSSVVATEAGD
jgi:hypothetical protein